MNGLCCLAAFCITKGLRHEKCIILKLRSTILHFTGVYGIKTCWQCLDKYSYFFWKRKPFCRCPWALCFSTEIIPLRHVESSSWILCQFTRMSCAFGVYDIETTNYHISTMQWVERLNDQCQFWFEYYHFAGMAHQRCNKSGIWNLKTDYEECMSYLVSPDMVSKYTTMTILKKYTQFKAILDLTPIGRNWGFCQK